MPDTLIAGQVRARRFVLKTVAWFAPGEPEALRKPTPATLIRSAGAATSSSARLKVHTQSAAYTQDRVEPGL